MLIVKDYIRERAVEYASRWAFSRNPLFYDYTGIGGNCTNFVSQCVYAGSCTMNFTPVFGWYYLSDKERTASWTGVEFFYNFIVGNKGPGPFGRECTEEELLVGDVIQLGRTEEGYYHTLLAVGFAEGVPLVASQSNDAFGRPLDSYQYDFARFIHIEGVRQAVPDTGDCYESVLAGIAIIPDYTGQTPPAAEETVPDETARGGMPGENAVEEGTTPTRTPQNTEGAQTPPDTTENAPAETTERTLPQATNTTDNAPAPNSGSNGDTAIPDSAEESGAPGNAGESETPGALSAEADGAGGNGSAPAGRTGAPSPSPFTDLSAGML